MRSVPRHYLRRSAPAVALIGVLACAVAGCTSSKNADSSASAVVSSLGAVPIPSASGADPTESAQPGKPAVLAIGGPVSVTLGGTTVLATALGPEQTVFAPPSGTSARGSALVQSTRAVITLRVVPSAGSVTVRAADLASRDETGRSIPLSPQGPSSVEASVGHPVTLRLAGTFTSGAAQVTWSPAGRPVAIWTFNIELD